jgi:hypothetical protein
MATAYQLTAGTGTTTSSSIHFQAGIDLESILAGINCYGRSRLHQAFIHQKGVPAVFKDIISVFLLIQSKSKLRPASSTCQIDADRRDFRLLGKVIVQLLFRSLSQSKHRLASIKCEVEL